MPTLKGTYTETHYTNVQVSTGDCVRALIREFNVPSNVFYRDGKFLTSRDVSYHGSPNYEYTEHEVPDNLKDALLTLLDFKKKIIDLGMATLRDFD